MGADLLVSEMIDLDATVARIARVSPNMPEAVKQEMVKHLATHHLAPQDVGKLAAGAAVGSLVLTHFAGGTEGPDREAALLKEVQQAFAHPVTLANDLDCF